MAEVIQNGGTFSTIRVSADPDNEVLQINDVKLHVLPTDIIAFQNNAIYEESYLRSKSVFAFRSKYASNKIIITLPISVNPYVSDNDGDKRSQQDGLKVLTQLTNFPYCFIRSPRIRSYISARSRISTTGFMMFAVDEINIVQDQRSPDVVFAEFHLLYCDFTSLTEDFTFRGDEVVDKNSKDTAPIAKTYKDVNNPEDSLMFTNAFDFDFEEKYHTIFKAAREMAADIDANNSTYRPDQTPFNMIQLLAPVVIARTEIGSGDFDQEFVDNLVETMDYKEIKVTAKNGNNSFRPDFLHNVNNQKPVDENTPVPNIEDSTSSCIVYWTNFHDLSFGGVSALKNIKISMKNKLAQQFVGSHKYPFIQYLGRYPTRLNISMDYNTGDFYSQMNDYGFDQEQSTVVTSLGQLNNVLDYNNEMFPEASAYNVIKIKSIISTLIGLESIVPNQSFISASSQPDSNGIEELNISFVEADVDEFMQMNKPFPGRPSWSDISTSVECAAIIMLYKKYRDASVREGILNTQYKEYYSRIADLISSAVKEGLGEFYGGVDTGQVFTTLQKMKKEEEHLSDAAKEYLADEELAAIKDYATGASTYNWPKWTNDWKIFSQEYREDKNDIILKYLEKRNNIMTKKASVVDGTGSDDVYTVNFVANADVNNNIYAAYNELLQLSNLNDPLAKSIITAVKSNERFSEKALIDFSNSYIGTNLDDLKIPGLDDPIVSPFYFLLFKPYFTDKTLETIAEGISKEVMTGLDKIITNNLSDVDNDHTSHFGFFNNQNGVMVQETRINSSKESEGYWNTTSYGYNGASLSAGVDRGGDYNEVPAGAANSNAYDEYILEAANKYGVPPGLIKAIIHTESTFINEAKSGKDAVGLMQIRTTAHPSFPKSDWYNPRANILYGTKYLAEMKSQFKDWESALAAYNTGPGNFIKAGRNWRNTVGETRAYVPKVMNRWNTLYKDGVQASSTNNTNRAVAANSKQDVTKARGLVQAELEQRYYDQTLKINDLVLAEVLKVEDGDTIVVNIVDPKTHKRTSTVEEIRVKYLDTPEKPGYPSDKEALKTADGKSVYPNWKGNPKAAEAKKKTAGLAPVGSKILLDVTRQDDVYGRKLSNVYLNEGKAVLAEKIIAAGLGTPWGHEQAGGSPILTKLLTMIKKTDNNSQTILDYKKKITSVRDNMKTKTSLEEIKATLRASRELLASGTFKYNGKEYNIDDEAAKDKPKEEGKGPADTTGNKSYPTKNYNIHLAGLQNNDPGNAKYISSQFGARTRVKNGKSVPHIHEGLDITANGTSPKVVAAAAGVVSTFYIGGGGKTVVIDHLNGFVTRYLHLSEFGVRHGQKVKAGDGIGLVGNTNSNKGTYDPSISEISKHLHMETWVAKSFTPNPGHHTIHPWDTVPLSMLDGLKHKEVWQARDSLISKKKTISGQINSVVTSRVYGLGGPGKLGVISGISANNAKIVNVQGQAPTFTESVQAGALETNGTDQTSPMDNVLITSADLAEVNLPPTSSVYYEKQAEELHYKNMAYHALLSLNMAFPVIKVYVIVGNEVEDPFIQGAVKLNHYFEIKGVQDVSISCNNDENPVDLLVMRIANPSFIRTDNMAVTGVNIYRNFSAETEAEVSFMADRLKLFPGARLHIRMGYSNNPNKLKTVFNGVITELGNDSSITMSVVAEGYGRELLMDQLHPGKPAFGRAIDTPQLISRAMSEGNSINHFGNKINKFRHYNIFKDSDDRTDPETKRLTTSYADVWDFYEPGNHRQRMYTNIYAAEIEKLHSNYNLSLKNHLKMFFGSDRSFINEQFGFGYVFNGQTPWDVLKEMEYRHPGTKMKPLFYQDRMTMFFGLKEQMYIARDLDPQYMKASEMRGSNDEAGQDYLLKRPLRFELVTGFHLASSEYNILLNNMKINNKFNTCANVVWFDNTSNMAEGDDDKSATYVMKADDTLSAFDERYGTVRMRGIHGKYSAFMYGSTYLRKEVEKMYGGSITLMGNPCIKAGDFIYINDNMRRIEGLLKVRECRHYMNAQTGFTTEITPGMFVENRNFIYSALMLKLSFVAKMALANSMFSMSIAANDEIDFTTYQEYLDALQVYAKKKGGWADGLGWDFMEGKLNAMHYETGNTPIIGAAFGAISAVGVGRFLFGTHATTTLGSALRSTLPGFRTAGTAATIFTAMRGFYTSSKTSAELVNYTREAIKTARETKSIISGVKGGLGIVGAASWFTMSRTLGALATVVGAALLTNPVGWLIRAGISIAFAYISAKVQEADLTRQPLLLFPVAYNGRPFMAGLAGYRYDSFWEAKKANYERNMDTISRSANLMSMTTTHTSAKILANLLKGSYVEDRVDEVRKSIVNSQNPDMLAKAEEAKRNTTK